MIDKSVPYAELMMLRERGIALPKIHLPDDYHFAFFGRGSEKDWASIVASVLEFKSEMDALIYFQRYFLPYFDELKRRCIFIETKSGEKIATITAWWSYNGTRRVPFIHWFAVKPEHQFHGLGNAILAKALHLFLEIEGDRDIYLHTQTWSHRAIKMYEKYGFEITREENIDEFPNKDYSKAISVLNDIFKNQKQHT